MQLHALVGVHLMIGSSRHLVTKYDRVKDTYTLRNISVIPFTDAHDSMVHRRVIEAGVEASLIRLLPRPRKES